MSAENETMGELIADWRKGRPVTADQIHTAWVREREALLKRARDNYAAGFAKGREAAERQPGNAAALREALQKITGLFRDIDLTIDCPGNEAYAIAEKALAAPARNCDKFTDAESARRAWLDDEESWDEFGSPKLKLHDWLLAPAAERKGEGDGN